MTVHAQLLEVLADGEWHSEADLLTITPFPREWVDLRHDGGEVAADQVGMHLVRLRQDPALPE